MCATVPAEAKRGCWILRAVVSGDYEPFDLDDRNRSLQKQQALFKEKCFLPYLAINSEPT